MTIWRASLTLLLAAFAVYPALAEDGDPGRGKTVFNQCVICHTIEPGKAKIGPSLHGIVGRQSASVPGFAYSAAMKKYDVTWNDDTLFTYLATPMKLVPGTKMAFAGLPKEQDRRDVIAYLNTLK
jgi:cytochrome c